MCGQPSVNTVNITSAQFHLRIWGNSSHNPGRRPEAADKLMHNLCGHGSCTECGGLTLSPTDSEQQQLRRRGDGLGHAHESGRQAQTVPEVVLEQWHPQRG